MLSLSLEPSMAGFPLHLPWLAWPVCREICSQKKPCNSLSHFSVLSEESYRHETGSFDSESSTASLQHFQFDWVGCRGDGLVAEVMGLLERTQLQKDRAAFPQALCLFTSHPTHTNRTDRSSCRLCYSLRRESSHSALFLIDQVSPLKSSLMTPL